MTLRDPAPRLALLGLLAMVAACPTPEDEPPPHTDPGDDGTLTDPLSMPNPPTVSLDEVRSASTCEACHPDHVAEWRTSKHGYAMQDPVFRALVHLRQEAFGGAEDRFCNQCHSPLGVRSGDVGPGVDFEALDPLTLEGVTCEGCHSVTDVARPHNAGHVLDVGGPMRAQIPEPVATSAHDHADSPLHGQARFCAGCHDVLEVSGLVMERPYTEWLTSPAAEAGQTCQDCHMPTREGPAAVGGPTRTVHRHDWVGADLPLTPGFLDGETEAARTAAIEALLQGKLEVTLTVPDTVRAGDRVPLLVDVRNTLDAHAYPTGSTFNRQVWLNLVVRDAGGDVVFETGDLDAQGDLRDAFSTVDPYGDADLVRYDSVLIDGRGNPTILTWEAVEHRSRAIQPNTSRTTTTWVQTAPTWEGPLTIDATVRFRGYGPHVLRALGLDTLVERLTIVDVGQARATLPVTGTLEATDLPEVTDVPEAEAP